MSRKKTMWFELQENEEIEDCLKRMEKEGYQVSRRKEEPLFQEVDGEIIPVRQIIKFQGILKGK